MVNEKLAMFEELIAMKDLVVDANIEKNIFLHIHPVLGDVVVSNLLSNAIKYTSGSGVIKVELTKNAFVVSNLGAALSSSENIFERFYKENSESTGLGLALVQQVAAIHKHSVKYSYAGGMHRFEYKF